jgi:hypothetical protein
MSGNQDDKLSSMADPEMSEILSGLAEAMMGRRATKTKDLLEVYIDSCDKTMSTLEGMMPSLEEALRQNRASSVAHKCFQASILLMQEMHTMARLQAGHMTNTAMALDEIGRKLDTLLERSEVVERGKSVPEGSTEP